MEMTIKIQDESITGLALKESNLTFNTLDVSIEEIISQRVLQEVEDYNQRLPEYYHGLVAPIHAEKTVNGIKPKFRKPIDGEKQVYIALDAFKKNGFFVLVNDVQIEQLEQRVKLSEDTKISFIKLTPLVGG